MSIDITSLEWEFFSHLGHWLGTNHFYRNVHINSIEAENRSCPGFDEKLRSLSLNVLNEAENTKYLRTALSVLSVVGTEKDIPAIETVYELNNDELSKDAKTCIFEIKHK